MTTDQELVSYATSQCRHRGQIHTVRYLMEDRAGTGDEERFDNHVAALERFVRLIRLGIQPESTLQWVKAFPSNPLADGECLYWERPKARHVIVAVGEEWRRRWWGPRHHTGTWVCCTCGIQDFYRDSGRVYAEMVGEEIIHTGTRR